MARTSASIRWLILTRASSRRLWVSSAQDCLRRRAAREVPTAVSPVPPPEQPTTSGQAIEAMRKSDVLVFIGDPCSRRTSHRVQAQGQWINPWNPFVSRATPGHCAHRVCHVAQRAAQPRLYSLVSGGSPRTPRNLIGSQEVSWSYREMARAFDATDERTPRAPCADNTNGV